MKRATLPLVIFGAWCFGMVLVFGNLEPYVVGAFCWGLAWLNERMMFGLSGKMEIKNVEVEDTYDFTPLQTLFEKGERK